MTVQQDVAPPAPALGWRELAFTRLGQVAVGLLLVELLAAMQVFLTATLLPAVAADLGGRAWYAAAIAASAATVFVTMPVSGPLADRLGPARVLALFAPAYVAGGGVSAAGPAVGVYVLGRAVQGLAAGGLATVALATVGGVLPAAWRPRMFALTSAMWIVPALIGPTYAALAAAAVGWRAAAAALLALGLLVRLRLAHVLPANAGTDGARRPLRVAPALLLALCMAIVATAATAGAAGAVAAAAAAVAALAVSRRLLMPGALRLRAGRPAAIGALLVLAAAYFGVDAVVVIVCRERLGASGLAAGLVLSAGALAWSLATVGRERLARRLGPPAAATVRTGALLLGAGCAAMAVVAATDGPIGALAGGWVAARGGRGVAD